MKAFPFFIPEKKSQIGFQTKITVTHRFSCFTSCQLHLFYGGKIVREQQRQLQRIHVPFESLTFSVARGLKLRDGIH